MPLVAQVKQEYVYAPTGLVDGTPEAVGSSQRQAVCMETDDGVEATGLGGDAERLLAELQVERVLHQNAREDLLEATQG